MALLLTVKAGFMCLTWEGFLFLTKITKNSVLLVGMQREEGNSDFRPELLFLGMERFMWPTLPLTRFLFMIKTAHILMILVIQENLLRQAGLPLTKKSASYMLLMRKSII